MFVLGAQKNLLIETVLLSAQNIYFDLEMRLSYDSYLEAWLVCNKYHSMLESMVT